MKPINVLVADGSPSVCRLIKSYLESDPGIHVTGLAQRGQQVIELVEAQPPDVITMGLEMSDMNGVQILRVLQEICPTPTIIISGANTLAAARTVEALHHGAVDFVFKFTPGIAVEPAAMRQEIITKVRIASHLKAPRLAGNLGQPQIVEGVLLSDQVQRLTERRHSTPTASASTVGQAPEKVIVVGASSGGPIALRQLLSHLPRDFSSSIIVVQHLPPSFTAVLAEQLNEQLLLEVREAKVGQPLEQGTVFITPGQFHLQVGKDGCFRFLAAEGLSGNCPSINLTMQSVAEVYGANARGVLLTGMGNDGTEGLAAIRRQGGTTFVQTPETCTVKGMPECAIEAGVADYIVAPDKIAQLLMKGY